MLLSVIALTAVSCKENSNETNTDTFMQNDECLICGAPLEYLQNDTLMECVICHKQEPSKTRCVEGHYVCNSCHTSGMDSIIAMCMEETSINQCIGKKCPFSPEKL